MPTWPHAPSREIDFPGRYMVTASTYMKQHLFNTPEKLELLEGILLGCLDQLGWRLQAWAVFPNHYHFVGCSPETGLGITELTKQVHRLSASDLNKMDDAVGRMVWYRSWDSRLTYDKSYLARLAYVHNNPVRHGIVREATHYKWCSARWFLENAERPFYDTVMTFKTDKVNVIDDF